MAAAENYFLLDGGAWTDEEKIRWMLMLMEGKANKWKEIQLARILEKDSNGDAFDEFTSWREFKTFFLTRWTDAGEDVRYRRKWKEGIEQGRWSAKAYFQELDDILAQLLYN
jgi:hypothetical protein